MPSHAAKDRIRTVIQMIQWFMIVSICINALLLLFESLLAMFCSLLPGEFQVGDDTPYEDANQNVLWHDIGMHLAFGSWIAAISPINDWLILIAFRNTHPQHIEDFLARHDSKPFGCWNCTSVGQFRSAKFRFGGRDTSLFHTCDRTFTCQAQHLLRWTLAQWAPSEVRKGSGTLGSGKVAKTWAGEAVRLEQACEKGRTLRLIQWAFMSTFSLQALLVGLPSLTFVHRVNAKATEALKRTQKKCYQDVLMGLDSLVSEFPTSTRLPAP